jgi:hypothetical protein
MKDLIVTLNPYMAPERRYWTRRPRTKKRRIRNKWKKRPENWRSEPNIVQTTLLLGSKCMVNGVAPPSPDEMPVLLEMNPSVWAQMEPAARKNFKTVTAIDGEAHTS